MKALRLHAPGDLRLRDEPDPAPSDGEELVRVTAIGLCGSDRHWYTEGAIGDAELGDPLVLGHEVAGIVADGPRRGERVALDPADPCGVCDLCRAGRGHLCESMRFLGYGTTDGGLRELIAWPSRLLHPLPDRVADAPATLLEPLAVAIHAVDLAAIEVGGDAGVYGCGPIGLLLVQLLDGMGCRVVATDVLEHRVEAARAMGAGRAELRGGGGDSALPEVDVAFEVAGEDAALDDAIRSVRPGGTVVIVGIPSTDRTSFTASAARRREVTLSLCRRTRGVDLPRAIALAAEARVELDPLVSERHPLADGPAAFASLAEHRGLKIVVEPGRLGLVERAP